MGKKEGKQNLLWTLCIFEYLPLHKFPKWKAWTPSEHRMLTKQNVWVFYKKKKKKKKNHTLLC